MQVSLFYSAGSRAVLVMPVSDSLALPEAVRDMAWAKMPNTTLNDPLLHDAIPVIQAEIGAYGFSVLPLIDQGEKTPRSRSCWKRWIVFLR